MKEWHDLITVAVVGTERQAFTAAATAPALNELLARLDLTDRAGALLHAAALTVLYERAGYVPPVQRATLPAPAQVETRPRCNQQVVARLRLLLQGEHAELLPEFLRELARANQRVPEEWLPTLLERGKANESLAELLPPVLGARGLWLGRQREEWRYVLGESEPETVWEIGTQAQRRALLKRLRQTDPARARELLEQTWEQDSPKTRAEFLSLLDVGLSPADEPLLEKALDEPWTITRKAAANLLTKLPASALVQRMCERAARLIVFKNSPRGKLSIEINLPAERDEAMARDAIVKTAPHTQIGEKAWWLQQIISAVPPVCWQEQAGRRVDELLQALKRHEYRAVLLDGWREAAIRTRATEWLESLLLLEKGNTWREKLFAALPVARQMSLATQMLALRENWAAPYELHQLISALPLEWDEAFSRAVIGALCAQAEVYTQRDDWTLRGLLTTLACRLHPDTLTTAIAQLESVVANPKLNSAPLEMLLKLLQFRHAMLKEIRP